MNWKPRPLSELEQAIDRLRVENIKLRREVETKQTQVGGLKLALQQRHETIDALNGQLEAIRAQCRRLDEEAKCYAAMIQRGPLREQY
jgi:predicted RNase H-like nuclease (RuvC/YqgF family)